MKKSGCFVHSLQTYYNRVEQIKQYVKDNREDRGRFSVLITQVDCPFDIKTENRPLPFPLPFLSQCTLDTINP